MIRILDIVNLRGIVLAHAKSLRHARDWQITTQDIIGVSAIVGIALKKFHFYSPSLQYAVDFHVVEGSLGAQIGIEALGNRIKSAMQSVSTEINVINRVASGARSGNSRWRIYRSFAANDMRGGTIGAGSFGATTGAFGGSGEVFTLFDNNQSAVARYDGGSAGLSLGFSVNIGTAAAGVIVNMHNEWTGH